MYVQQRLYINYIIKLLVSIPSVVCVALGGVSVVTVDEIVVVGTTTACYVQWNDNPNEKRV